MRKLRRRRRLQVTSLIDVIFLLLLFFMLSSTFTKFAEVELAAGGGGSGVSEQRPVFLSLAPDAVQLNGQLAALDALPEQIMALQTAPGVAQIVLVALQGPVTSQRLTDLLVSLRAVSDLKVTVLGGR